MTALFAFVPQRHARENPVTRGVNPRTSRLACGTSKIHRRRAPPESRNPSNKTRFALGCGYWLVILSPGFFGLSY